MQLLATLCTSMPTVRRTSLRRRVFWCRVKPGGGSVMRHAYASLYACRQKARSEISNVLRIMRTSFVPRSLPPTFWPLRTTHHASVLCKLCQRGSLGPLRTVYYAQVLRSGIVNRGWLGLELYDRRITHMLYALDRERRRRGGYASRITHTSDASVAMGVGLTLIHI
mgnify:CR=1 FL=1